MWTSTEIKIALMRKGTNLTEIAVKAGLSAGACRGALIRPIPAAEKVIAEELGVPVEEVFPDRYSNNEVKGVA